MSRKILIGAVASLALLAAFAMPSVSEASGPRSGNATVRHVRHRNNHFRRTHRARTVRHYHRNAAHNRRHYGHTNVWRGNNVRHFHRMCR
jgi:hypothetical protein